jgi:2-oxoglutarate/2-oxoacid ferredoxin oxidoreductase subunit beta
VTDTVPAAPTAVAFRSTVKPTWCPGCGDYGVLNALQGALARLKIENKDVVVVSGIGCSSELPHFIRSYGLHTLHGRGVAVAQGVKLANHKLTVVSVGGDGDGYGIGVGHLIHALRRNIDMTAIVMDNQIYGLTTGQTSPTSMKGVKTKSTPLGNVENALNPLAVALAAGASFLARGFSGDGAHLTDIFAAALSHRGFSLVDVFSPCVTFNKWNTFSWFRERVYKLEEKGHDTGSLQAALAAALETEKLPIGVFYKSDRPAFEDEEHTLTASPVPLVQRPLGLSDETWKTLIEEAS